MFVRELSVCAWNPPFSDYEGKDYFGQTAAVVCLSTYAHTNTVEKKLFHMWGTEAGKYSSSPHRQDRQSFAMGQSIISHRKRRDSNNRGGSLFCPTFFWGDARPKKIAR